MTRARNRRPVAASPAPASTESGAPSSHVDFGAPVPVGRRATQYDWRAIAEKVKKASPEWGKVFDRDKASIATAIRAGNVSAVRPSMGFEVRTSNNDHKANPRTCSMWMRYIPENDTTKESK